MADNNITKLLRALTSSAQSLEDALQQLLTERSLDTAVGAQLDVIGKIVRQSRGGLDDDDYRRYLRARIATSNSDGNIEDVLRVADLIINDTLASLVLENQGIAAYVLRIEEITVSDDLSDILIAFLRQATSAGVRVILESSPEDPSTWFQWDTVGQGWDQGNFIDAKD